MQVLVTHGNIVIQNSLSLVQKALPSLPLICSNLASLAVTLTNLSESMVSSILPILLSFHSSLANGLSSITLQKMAEAFQVTDSNPIVGLQGRTTLLSNLASALNNNPTFFGQDARPGNIIDHLQHHLLITHNNPPQLPLTALWHVLIHGLSSIWPSSTTSLNGIPLGDVWTCPALTPLSQSPGDDLIPFHKLTSWLTYSIIEPIEQILGWLITEKDLLTGLPEYRNGGLLIDLGVLSLKPGSIPLHPDTLIPRLPPSHPAIVEWRAMTIIELQVSPIFIIKDINFSLSFRDRIADLIRDILGLSPQQLSLPQILESATWKAGRIIANQIRPLTGGPPIDIESDGTVF